MRYRALFVLAIVSPLLWRFALPVGEKVLRWDWLVAVLIGGLMLGEVASGLRRFRPDRGVVLFLWFHAALLASLYYPLTHGGGEHQAAWLTNYMLYVFGGFLFLSAFTYRVGEGAARGLLTWYVGAGVVAALFGIVQFVGSGIGLTLDLPYSNPAFAEAGGGYEQRLDTVFRRSYSLFMEPRQYGAYLITPLLVVLTSLYYRARLIASRQTEIILASALGFGLFASLSTSAMLVAVPALGFVFGLQLWLAPRHIRRRAAFIVALVLAALVLVAVYVALSDDGIAKFLRFRLSLPDTGQLLRQVSHVNQRIVWGGWGQYVGNAFFAIVTFLKSPIVGVGLNNLELHATKAFSGAHGLWQLLADTGVVGVTAVLVLFGYYGRKTMGLLAKLSRQRFPNRDLALASCAFFLVLTPFLKSFSTGLYQFSSILLWTDLALALVVYRALRHGVAVRCSQRACCPPDRALRPQVAPAAYPLPDSSLQRFSVSSGQ